MNKDQVRKIFNKQKEKSLQLRTESIKDRKRRLHKLRRWILDNKSKIREAAYQDLRKSELEADIFEIYPVTSELNKAIRNLRSWSRAKPVPSGLAFIGTQSVILPEPKGTCLIIAPWNFPFNLMIAPLVTCLAAGNTAILKPSEMTKNTSALITSMIDEVFEPTEVYVVEGAVEETTFLLSLPFDHMFFTGSTKVGSIVMEAAAKVHASCTLELGGKSPTIIDESASIKDAAKKIAWGKFVNSGQTCVAPDHIFVHESIAEDFTDQLKKNITSLFSDDGNLETSGHYPRLVNEKHGDRMVNMLEDAKKKNGQIGFGGNHKLEDKYFEPTVISDFDDDSTIWKEEIFGPILPIRTYSDLDEVISHINSNGKPLSVYHFSRDKKLQKKIALETSSGGLAVNETVIHQAHPNLGFGGVGASGMGRSHGHSGFLEFSNQKAIMKQRIGLTNLFFFYPPYSKFGKWLAGILIRWF